VLRRAVWFTNPTDVTDMVEDMAHVERALKDFSDRQIRAYRHPSRLESAVLQEELNSWNLGPAD
jgi:hypothetical protein